MNKSSPGTEAVRPCAPAEILELFKGGYISVAEAIADLEPAFMSPTLQGQIAAVYGELDAEDCAFVDREWAKQRGYILPADGTSQLIDAARVSPVTEAGFWWYVEFFSAPLIALMLTPFVIEFILWSVRP